MSCFSLVGLLETLEPTRLLCPWDFSGKNTGVGCRALLDLPHPGIEPESPALWADVFLLLLSHCYLVAQSHPTLWDPMDDSSQASLSFTISRSLLKLSPLSDWCHPTISSSVVPFSSCSQSFPALGSFPVSQLFASDGQSHRGSPFTQSHLHLNSIYQRNRALMYIYFNFVEKGNQPRQSCEDIQLLLT